MNTMNITRRGQLGFTIIEALISLVVMGFGILALAGMQNALSRNADDAKQRTEAVRLAQEKIEEFRSYTGISSTVIVPVTTSTTALNWSTLAGGTDSITTNAAYTRTWAIGGSSADPMRGLTVTVTWTDRAGDAQTVSLSSVLSKTDVADSGFLGFPLPLNTNLKRPKDRNLDIPIPAIDLGNGESAVKFGNSGQYVLFGNISGDVVKICTPTLTGTPTNADVIAALTSTDASTSNCTTITGYIVAGYVGRDSSVSNTDWTAIQNGLGIDYSGITRNAAGAAGISCQFGDAVDQSTGTVIANYKYYLCVVPLATPTTPPATNGPYNWSGTIRIAGPAVWHGSANKYYVCRYQYAATNSLTDINQRNIQPYVEVNKSIDQQNYLIATTSNATSTTAPVCPSSMNVTNVSTGVMHQDCRSASNTSYATACPLLGATSSYTVTYDANDGTGSVPVDSYSPYSNGSTVTVLGNTGPLAKTGYSFNGWSTVAGGGTSYNIGGIFTINANTTLYAKWTQQAIYTITYSAGSGTGTVTDSNNYISGQTATVLSGASLSRSGYIFGGWDDGASHTYTPGQVISITGDMSLTALWTPVVTRTVAYDGNNATGGSVPIDTNAYASGSAVTVKTNTGTLIKTGYSFNGWSTAPDSGASYSVGATFVITVDTTLYAKWAQVTLATPAPQWVGSSNPKSLGWAAVNGATGYIVSSCSVINSASTTSCTPASSNSQTGISVIPPTLGNKDTWCYQVIATGSPYVQSTTSTLRCISRAANGNYSYQ